MRTNEEFINEVFTRMCNKSAEAHSHKVKLLILFTAVTISVVIGTAGAILLSDNGDPANASSYGSEMNPENSILVLTNSGDETDADLHRPIGYNDNIKSALALKLEYAESDNQRFAVLMINMSDDKTFAELISDANKVLSDKIDFSSIQEIALNDHSDSKAENGYISNLSSEQIRVLAENNISLKYIGSGKGDNEKIDFNSAEGVNNYCELKGDMLIFTPKGSSPFYSADE